MWPPFVCGGRCINRRATRSGNDLRRVPLGVAWDARHAEARSHTAQIVDTATMTRYLALLRGINVGGKNLIRMTDLAACFEEQGFREVATYIQSGNVIFDAPGSSAAKLTKEIEAMLREAFGYDASVVLRSEKQLRKVVDEAPRGFGREPARYRYDVLFLKAPLKAPKALAQVPTKEGVDAVHPGPDVLYFSRLVEKASQSRMSRITSMPIYKSMTIRNWNTTTKLLHLMEGSSAR